MDIKPENIEKTWDKLAKTFNNWRGIRPRPSWVKTGLSERAGYDRLRKLENSAEAAKFYELTKTSTARELRYLLKRAELNFEQAAAASRLSTVLNATILIGAIVLFNQLFPGLLAEGLKDFLTVATPADFVFVILFFGGGFLLITIILAYSYGGTAQARDLKHLLELSLARRAFHGGKRESGTGDDPSSALRETYLSDI